MVRLREVREADLAVLFEQQLDAGASYMAAFTAEDPTDKAAFVAKWRRILNDETVTAKIVLYGDDVAGSIARYRDSDFGEPEVTYWLGREFWGKGIATAALTQFLELVTERPIYGRAAADNVASIRVLEKCGFVVTGRGRGFANARRDEIDELILTLAETP